MPQPADDPAAGSAASTDAARRDRPEPAEGRLAALTWRYLVPFTPYRDIDEGTPAERLQARRHNAARSGPMLRHAARWAAATLGWLALVLLIQGLGAPPAEAGVWRFVLVVLCGLAAGVSACVALVCAAAGWIMRRLPPA